jgi:hypothetical protein
VHRRDRDVGRLGDLSARPLLDLEERKNDLLLLGQRSDQLLGARDRLVLLRPHGDVALAVRDVARGLLEDLVPRRRATADVARDASRDPEQPGAHARPTFEAIERTKRHGEDLLDGIGQDPLRYAEPIQRPKDEGDVLVVDRAEAHEDVPTRRLEDKSGRPDTFSSTVRAKSSRLMD